MKTELETKTKLKHEAKQLLQTFDNRYAYELNYLCVLTSKYYPTLFEKLTAKFCGQTLTLKYKNLFPKELEGDFCGGLLFELRKLYLAHIAKYGRLPADKTVGKFITKLSEKGNS